MARVTLCITILLVMFFGKVWACNDFDSCMENSEVVRVNEIGMKSNQYSEGKILKAIAYKLDELSKTQKEVLYANKGYGWDCIKRASDGFCQEEKKWKE